MTTVETGPSVDDDVDPPARPIRQLVQSVKTGELSLTEIPLPSPSPTEVLVATRRSVVSPGTERAVTQLASANLLQKAKARPDLVRQVVTKARTDGIRRTANAVRTRLDDIMPLGYSGAGVAVEVGEYVEGIRPGMRVATGGAGHGDYQLAAGLLTVPIPDEVSDENAAFATVASIALHGLRLAELGPGSRVCVIGLGLVGQITCRLAQASGYLVSGIDLQGFAVAKAAASGVAALDEKGDYTTRSVREWARGRGVDAVIVTAASSSSEPVRRATEIARDRAPIIVVGDVGLELDRRPFYERELTLKVARSYGPGRYERSYEDWGVDYPPGQVRWTEGRNLEAVLDLLAEGRVDFSDLVTHRFDLERAKDAYRVIEGERPFFGVQLTYPEPDIDLRPGRRTIAVGRSTKPASTAPDLSSPRIGLLGAGNFVRATLLPAIKQAELGPIEAICSAGGGSARFLADRHGIPKVSTDASEVINDPDVDLVMIATPPDTHADLVVEALQAGKHVFCEKPLALTHEELDRIEAAWKESGRRLAVGHNRRFSPMARAAKAELTSAPAAATIIYRVVAPIGVAGSGVDVRSSGGFLAEATHFVDLCRYLAGAEVAGRSLIQSTDRDGPVRYSTQLRFDDDSLAVVVYTTDAAIELPKEHIQVHQGGRSLVLDNFNRLAVNGQNRRITPGKGHSQSLLALTESSLEAAIQRTIDDVTVSRISLELLEASRSDRATDTGTGA
ncbi:MAG: bi-domain-containing oxidoreductase [Actinomycetota bacterium]